jgi:hypothetical protein
VAPGSAPRPSLDHSRAVPVALVRRRPERACDENPLTAPVMVGG